MQRRSLCPPEGRLTRALTAPDGIPEAARLLLGGGVVGFGTETVYGLGADARLGRAVARVFAVKGRPRFNPLICHFSSAALAFREVQASGVAEVLAERFWPGALTLVLPRRAGCSVDLLAGAGLDTLAVRVPGNRFALALLELVGGPVAAPSANRSGGVSPTTAGHVLADLGGRIDAVLDCGPCLVGVESTVLDLTGERAVLLRPGGVPVEEIEAVVGGLGETGVVGVRAPGMLVSHYAPALPVRLDAVSVREGEALLAFGAGGPAAGLSWNLSESGDLVEAASRLFAGLRWLDSEGLARGFSGIAAMAVPSVGLGVAINDRLRRAAAARG